MSDLRDTPRAFPVEESREVFAGRVFSMWSEKVRFADAVAQRDFVRHPGAVAIVALREAVKGARVEDSARVEDGAGVLAGGGEPEVLLINQYRHPVGMMLWEVPAGLTDVAGEDLLAAAQRELAEETDLRAARWDVLVDYYTTPGGSTEGLRVFLARELSEIPVVQRSFVRREEEAFMTRRWVGLSQAVEAIFAGQIHNPSAVVGILAVARAWEHPKLALREAKAPWLGAGQQI